MYRPTKHGESHRGLAYHWTSRRHNVYKEPRPPQENPTKSISAIPNNPSTEISASKYINSSTGVLHHYLSLTRLWSNTHIQIEIGTQVVQLPRQVAPQAPAATFTTNTHPVKHVQMVEKLYEMRLLQRALPRAVSISQEVSFSLPPSQDSADRV